MEYARKTKRAGAEISSAGEKEQLSRRIYAAAGVESRKSVDPVYALTSRFIKTFDETGRRRYAEMRGENGENADLPENAANPPENENGEYSHRRMEPRSGDFGERFSGYAFSKGRLAASILSGKGKMMLTACFRRTAWSRYPLNSMQTELDENRSLRRPIKGVPAQAVFNQDVHTAVGIVVDAVQSANRTLNIIKLAAQGSERVKSPQSYREITAVNELFPFLITDEDDSIIADCRERLRELESGGAKQAAAEKSALVSALQKAQSVRQRKLEQQRYFLTKLDEMRNNALEAERLFASEGFAESVISAIEEPEELPEPPPDDNGGRRRRRLKRPAAPENTVKTEENDADNDRQADENSSGAAGEPLPGEPEQS